MRDFTDELSALRRRLDEASQYLGLESLRSRLAELEAELGRPDLWDNTEVGQRVTREYGQVKGDVDVLERLRGQLDDAPQVQRPMVLGSAFDRVGRNDPCPCGSGKKFKFCHGR